MKPDIITTYTELNHPIKKYLLNTEIPNDPTEQGSVRLLLNYDRATCINGTAPKYNSWLCFGFIPDKHNVHVVYCKDVYWNPVFKMEFHTFHMLIDILNKIKPYILKSNNDFRFKNKVKHFKYTNKELSIQVSQAQDCLEFTNTSTPEAKQIKRVLENTCVLVLNEYWESLQNYKPIT